MNLLDLDEDTMTIIVSYLSTEDARRLYATARGLQFVAKRKALSVLDLHGQKHSSKACLYLLQDVPGRLQWLRKLVVFVIFRKDIRDLAPLLAQVLDQVQNLQDLCLHVSHEWVATESRIGTALENLESLQTLVLHGVNTPVLEVVRKMRSQLRKVCLDVNGAEGSSNAETTSAVPSRCDDVLTSLEFQQHIRVFQVGFYGMKNAALSLPGHQWPSITTLIIRNHTSRSVRPRYSDFVHAFPRLRNLRRLGGPLIWSEGPHQGLSWPHMDHLQGDLPTLKTWREWCPVYHLEFEEYVPWSSDAHGIERADDFAATLSVIECTTPVVLSFNLRTRHMDVNDCADPALWTKLIHRAPRLRVVNIGYDMVVSDQLWEWLDHIPAILAHMKIEILLLRMDRWMADLEPSSSIIAKYLEAITSLQYFAVSYGGVLTRNFGVLDEDAGLYRPDPSFMWWRISSGGGVRTGKRIPAELGEKVASYLFSPMYDSSTTLDDSKFVRHYGQYL